MPEMTKEDPEPQADAPDPEACVRCGTVHGRRGDKDGPEPGSRSWFWAKRLENMMLWFAPGVPLMVGTWQLASPSVTVALDDKQQAAINGVYDMPGGSASTVERVTIYLDHPGVADRIVAAGPSLLFGALLAFVAYALWRIEINLSATGKYTPKDGKVLSAATRWLWRGWWALLAAEIAVSVWFRDVPSSDHWYLHSVATPFDNASWMTLVIVAVVGIVARIYRSGARAYAELEKGV